MQCVGSDECREIIPDDTPAYYSNKNRGVEQLCGVRSLEYKIKLCETMCHKGAIPMVGHLNRQIVTER